jgi:hypothetical protein
VGRTPAGCDREGMTSTTDILYRELDHRSGDGIDVRLLWRPSDDSLHVTASDARTGEHVTIAVRDRARGREVFLHPFAHAPATAAPLAAAA